MKVFYNCHIYNNLGDCFVVEDNKFVYDSELSKKITTYFMGFTNMISHRLF